jgi:hypothetical protein
MESCVTLQHVELFDSSFVHVVTNVFSVSFLLPSLISVLFLYHSCCYRYPSDIAGCHLRCFWGCLTILARCIPSIGRDVCFQRDGTRARTAHPIVHHPVSDEAVGDAVLAHLRALPGNPSTSWVQALCEAMNAVPLPVTDAPSSVGATHGSNSSHDTVSTLSSAASSGSRSDAGNNNGTCMELCVTLQHVELFDSLFVYVVTNVFSVSFLLPSLILVLFLYHSCCYRYSSDIAGCHLRCFWGCLTISVRCIPSIGRDVCFQQDGTRARTAHPIVHHRHFG